MPYSLSRAARDAARLGLTTIGQIPTGDRSGLLLTTRDGNPGVLGFGAIDQFGEAAALALSEEEATLLRDALTRWLEDPPEPTPEALAAVAPDPWTNPDAAATHTPPPF